MSQGLSTVKNFIVEKVTQREDLKAVYVRKANYFEAEKRINHIRCINTGHRQYNNLKWPEKKRTTSVQPDIEQISLAKQQQLITKSL